MSSVHNRNCRQHKTQSTQPPSNFARPFRCGRYHNNASNLHAKSHHYRSSTTLTTCPAGFYCHQVPIYSKASQHGHITGTARKCRKKAHIKITLHHNILLQPYRVFVDMFRLFDECFCLCVWVVALE